MKIKICSKCKIEKELNCFHRDKQKKDGFEFQCKECRKEYRKKNEQKIKERYQKNKEKKSEYAKEYYKNNKEKCNQRDKIWYSNNREKKLEKGKDWERNNKEKRNIYFSKYYKNKRKTDLNYKIKQNESRRIRIALKNEKKLYSTIESLGCTIDFLRKHLEQQFYCHPISGEMMTWENYGRLWHIDHIKPLCSFDLTNKEQYLKAFHYTNLQPLWAEDNLKKGNKIL